MVAVRVLLFIAGLTLVGWTLLSAIRTVILPRNAQRVISRIVFRGLALLFGWLGAGYISLSRIAGSFGIDFDPDPHPDDPISVTRFEFDEAWDVLAGAGLALVDDRDQAWRDFSGWRVNYDTVLLSMAEVLRAPYAAWTADRSAVGYRRPRLRRFGRREAGRTER